MAALHDRGTRSSTPNPGSAVQTVTHLGLESPRIIIPDGTLRLRGVSADDRRVMWAENVVDNEGMGKKKSKVCCIYHKPHTVGESSGEDSSSSDSSSDSDEDNSTARMSGSRRWQSRHEHGHGGDAREHNHGPRNSKGKGRARPRRRSPNAYEKMPKYKPSKEANP